MTERSEILAKAVFDRIKRSNFDAQTLIEIWGAYREQYSELLGDARSPDLGFLEAMRGGAYEHVADVLKFGAAVVRPTVSPVTYYDVLERVAGSSMEILAWKGGPGRGRVSSTLESHPGEELSCVLEGKANFEYLTYQKDPHSKERRLKPEVFEEMSPSPGRRTIWLKGRIPHAFRPQESVCGVSFFADTLGARAICEPKTEPTKYASSSTIDPDAVGDLPDLWRSYFAVGPRVRAVRAARGLGADEIVGVLGSPESYESYLSRFERGNVNPTLAQIVRFASALRVPPAEICPDDVALTMIKGCYLAAQAAVDSYLDARWSYSPSEKLRLRGKAQVPYVWPAGGMHVLLCASPVARSLSAFYVYLDGGTSSAWQTDLQRVLAEANTARRKGAEFAATSAEIAILCLQGTIAVDVYRWPESFMLPSIVRDRGTWDSVTIKERGLLYIRPGHAFRFAIGATPGVALVVVHDRRTAFANLRPATPKELAAVNKSLRTAKRGAAASRPIS